MISRFAAKSGGGELWLSFPAHAYDCGFLMRRLAERWLSEGERRVLCGELPPEELGRLCLFLGLVHDIGKLTKGFQLKLLYALPAEYREWLEERGVRRQSGGEESHALAGEILLTGLHVNPALSAIVGSHHGRPQEVGSTKNKYPALAKANGWEPLWKAWLDNALALSGYADVAALPSPNLQQQMLLTGLLITADWIASNPRYFPLTAYGQDFSPEDLRQRQKTAWAVLVFPTPWSGLSGLDFAARFGFVPNEVQEAMLAFAQEVDAPGMVILEAHMGVGKTEAALAAAELLAARRQEGGLLFCLPTQATADAIFKRLLAWAEPGVQEEHLAVRLAHGRATFNEDYKALFQGSADEEPDAERGLYANTWFSGNKQALLANFVVGTIDQLLLCALKSKHVMLRHLGVAGKVVILDECHAYDAYMNVYLDRALQWLGAYRVPVILLTATLPAQRRAELLAAYLGAETPALPMERAYPLLTWTEGQEVRQRAIPYTGPRRRVTFTRLREGEAAAFLGERLREGGCGAVLLNTVKKAQRMAEALQQALPGYTVLLIHSRFVAADRWEREKALLKRTGKEAPTAERDRFIVVGTQVLEQSLDYSVDIMLTELCPMDLLLQRIGRLHRHQRALPPPLQQAVCGVFTLEEGELDKGSARIYTPWLLTRTEALLPEAVTLPDGIPDLVQETYREPERETDAYLTYKKKLNDKEARAENFRLRKPYLPKDPTRVKKSLNSLHGLLNLGPTNEQKGEASVRDGVDTLEVLLMVRVAGRVCFLPWQYGGEAVDWDRVPDEETAKRILRQRLRLPNFYEKTEEIIDELERLGEAVSTWQQSPLLRGELFLLLDEALTATLCGEQYRYTRERGWESIDNGTGI